MNFMIEYKEVDDTYHNIVMIASAHMKLISYLVMISNQGLELANTGYPQPEVDYDLCKVGKKVRVMGVDEI